jgi:hypothetical protein
VDKAELILLQFVEALESQEKAGLFLTLMEVQDLICANELLGRVMIEQGRLAEAEAILLHALEELTDRLGR